MKCVGAGKAGAGAGANKSRRPKERASIAATERTQRVLQLNKMVQWKREHFKNKIKSSNSIMSVETDNVNASLALQMSIIDASERGQKLLEHVKSLEIKGTAGTLDTLDTVDTVDSVDSFRFHASSTRPKSPSKPDHTTTTAVWINEMDIILRSQVTHTHPTDPRSAAIAYATAITFIIFAFIQTVQTMQISKPSIKTQGHIAKVVDACNDLLHLATPSKQATQPNSKALMQYIAVHYKVARATPTPTMSTTNIKSIARATATLSFIIHTLSVVASIIPTHNAITAIQRVIVTPTPPLVLLADVVAFNTPPPSF
jgi:hypothetical protein